MWCCAWWRTVWTWRRSSACWWASPCPCSKQSTCAGLGMVTCTYTGSAEKKRSPRVQRVAFPHVSRVHVDGMSGCCPRACNLVIDITCAATWSRLVAHQTRTALPAPLETHTHRAESWWPLEAFALIGREDLLALRDGTKYPLDYVPVCPSSCV